MNVTCTGAGTHVMVWFSYNKIHCYTNNKLENLLFEYSYGNSLVMLKHFKY